MTVLSDKMRDLAAAGHPRADELRARADEFDIKEAASQDGGDALKPFLGAWARARRLWCECTGEALV